MVRQDNIWIVGVDLGFFADHTVICILQRIQNYVDAQFKDEKGEKRGKPVYHLRHLENVPLKTEYPVIIKRCTEIMDKLEEHDPKYLVLDRTGGEGVFQSFPRYFEQRKRTVGISITAGAGYTRVPGGYHVAKQEIVSALIAVAQAWQPAPSKFHRLEIAPEIKDSKLLVEEFQSFTPKLSESGNLQYGGRSGKHDDIVLSIGIAIWFGENGIHQLEAIKNPFDYSGQIHYGDKKF